MRRRDAVAGGGIEIDAHLDLRRQHLFLDIQIGHAGNPRQPLAQQAGLRTQGIEVFAKHLDGDLRPHTGQHVVDAVGDRLADADAGRQVAQALPDVGIDRFLRPPLRLELDIELGDVDALGMLVQFGPPGAPPHVVDFRQAAQRLLGRPGDADRLGQRHARIEAQAKGDRAFVEGGQESGRKQGHGQHGQHDGDGGPGDQPFRRSEHGFQRPPVMPFQPDHQARLAMRLLDQGRQQQR